MVRCEVSKDGHELMPTENPDRSTIAAETEVSTALEGI
jgi:hypothetical protein